MLCRCKALHPDSVQARVLLIQNLLRQGRCACCLAGCLPPPNNEGLTIGIPCWRTQGLQCMELAASLSASLMLPLLLRGREEEVPSEVLELLHETHLRQCSASNQVDAAHALQAIKVASSICRTICCSGCSTAACCQACKAPSTQLSGSVVESCSAALLS